ncbi:MAG: SH3 domain-containing protein [Clostridiales bacterium]|nr:SH3 domain-containing protein [Clostridiales bacterium]
MKNFTITLLFILLLFIPIHTNAADESLLDYFKAYPYDRQIILDQNQIINLNENIIDTIPEVNNIIYEKTSMSEILLTKAINFTSFIPSSSRYDENRNLIAGNIYDGYLLNMNLSSINESNDITYGVVIKRAPLKRLPTTNKLYSSTTSSYDRLLETTLYVGEPVAILHVSADNKFYYVKMYNYSGWVEKEAIAYCSREVIFLYIGCSNFAIVTKANTLTNKSNTQLDLGSKLPLISVDRNYNLIVLLPKTTSTGQLYFVKEAIFRIDCEKGYLPYTTKNLIDTALSLIGDPYGWGGDNNGRDCSSYIVDIYSVFGIKLPRNTDQQELIPTNTFSLKTNENYESLSIGSLLFMKGHVMMYLGDHGEKRYMIHDTPGFFSDGKFVNANGVIINDFDIYSSSGTPYQSLIYLGISLQ